MKKANDLIFYAPLVKGLLPEKIGGAEMGCLKTKKIYDEAGLNVICLNKPAISKGKLAYMIGLLFVPFKLFYLLLRYPESVLHIVGFYNKIVKYEWFLMKIGKLLGHKIIYEIRNGSMLKTYNEGTRRYRMTLEDLLLKSDVVLCQGQEYVDFIKNKWAVERSYYPNYILDDFIQPNCLNRKRPVRLIYFGRVTESKNIDVIIEVLAQVRNAGCEAILEVIGGYSERYKLKLDDKVRSLGVSEYVMFYGRQPMDFIVKHLRCAHYFVFPSQERQEGHSNSLTEAMGCGVVPIVSDVGFNVSICGDDYFVVHEIEASGFANKIVEIETLGKWQTYSQQAYDRIQSQYTQSIVSKKLLESVMPLFCNE